MVRKTSDSKDVAKLNIIDLPLAWSNEYWASSVVPISTLKKIINQSLIEHPLRGLSLPGILLLDGRRGCSVKNKGVLAQVYQGLTLISGNELLSNKSAHCLILLKDIDAGDRQSARQFGTNTQRIEVGTAWKQFEIISEPFVQPTALGYAPTILIRDSKGFIGYLLVGARSLARPLEERRSKVGSLIGLKIKVCKSGDSSAAPYLIEFV
jgi:hypothetical protein